MHNPNLLPAHAIRDFQRKRLRGLWLKVATIAFLTAVVCIFIGRTQASKQMQQLETLHRSASQPRDRLTQLNQKLVSYRRLQQISKKQAELRSHYSPLTVLELLHRCKEQLDGKLQVVSLDYTDESDRTRLSKSSSSAKAAGAAKPSNGHLQLRLITEGSARSSAVMQYLQASGYFDQVNLISSLEQIEAGRLDLQFTIRCTF